MTIERAAVNRVGLERGPRINFSRFIRVIGFSAGVGIAALGCQKSAPLVEGQIQFEVSSIICKFDKLDTFMIAWFAAGDLIYKRRDNNEIKNLSVSQRDAVVFAITDKIDDHLRHNLEDYLNLSECSRNPRPDQLTEAHNPITLGVTEQDYKDAIKAAEKLPKVRMNRCYP